MRVTRSKDGSYSACHLVGQRVCVADAATFGQAISQCWLLVRDRVSECRASRDICSPAIEYLGDRNPQGAA